MRWIWNTLTALVIGGLLLSFPPEAMAQAKPEPPPKVSAPAPAPAPQRQVVVVEPVRVYDPFYDYPYAYVYEPEYMQSNFGYVKIDTKDKGASVYIDGGFADKIGKAKKFALRPGRHDVELRDSDGRTIYRERVAITPGRTTELKVG